MTPVSTQARKGSLSILQVNTRDGLGGAENVAADLSRAYRDRGHHSWLAVGWKTSDDPYVITVPNDVHRSRWARYWIGAGNTLPLLAGALQGSAGARHLIHSFGEPRRSWEVIRGHEDFDFPGTWQIPNLVSDPPDILHCHNLHGGYFDLRALPRLSDQLPVMLTLHDAWLLSGHCAHSFDCERWQEGCGACPDLTTYPAILRDATAFNWQRKKTIFGSSRLFLAVPSQWLMRKVLDSMLCPAVEESRIIPNGVDLGVFHPADKRQVRMQLEIPPDARVLLFAGYGIRRNRWKDYPMLQAAMAILAERSRERSLCCIGLGDTAPSEQLGKTSIRFIPYEQDPARVARYYQAADVYLHASRADTFPTTILEAMACGTPVVATAVGGIPEQVEHGETGFLVAVGDAEDMAYRVQQVLVDGALGAKLGEQAAESARVRFDLRRQADAYLEWFGEIVARRNPITRSGGRDTFQ